MKPITQKKSLNHNSNKKTKHNKKYCSPKKENNSYTCFTKKALLSIVDEWNTKYPKDKINNKLSLNRNQLWSVLNNKMRGKCSDELCWVNTEFKTNKAAKSSFRPKMPNKWYNNKNEWLTTIDIEKVLKQYESKYPEFLFLGPVPIDFDSKIGSSCIVNEICNLSVEKLIKNNKTKLGIIFNLDRHDQPGSHWVAMFADLMKGQIYYFDSYGEKAPLEIIKLMSRLKEQCQNLNIPSKINYNNTRHQYKFSECGMYCINFIIQLLEGKSFDNVCRNIIDDDTMEKYREYYFIKKDK